MSVHHLDLTEIAQQVLDELPQNVEYIRDPRKIKPTNTDAQLLQWLYIVFLYFVSWLVFFLLHVPV